MSFQKIISGDELTMSKDILQENIIKLKELFPELVSENKIDFEAFKQVFSVEAEQGEEYYRFTWAGKAQARREAHKPSTGTLRPAKEESVNWDTTENLYIEGDNLEVLKLLQKSYNNKVKMIYIDPPYNTGNDFVYKDNYKDNLKNYQQISGQIDDEGNKLTTNSDSDGRYHSNWLNMMYPRLVLARNLLKEDGVIFMSIDDNEVENLKKIGSEIFGNSNFVGQLIWKKKYIGGKHAKHFVDLHEYVIVFAKNILALKEIIMERPSNELKKFTEVDEHLEEKGKFYTRPLKSNLGLRKTLIYPIEMPDGEIIETQWMVAEETFLELKEEGRVFFKQKRDGAYNVYRKYYANDGGGNVKVPTLIDDVFNADGKVEIKTLFNIKEGRDIPFDNPKPTKLLTHLIKPILSKIENEIILDFFSGSGTTADAVMQLNAEDNGNRKFIQVQLPEIVDDKSEAYKAGYKTITEIGKERIRKAGKKIAEENPDKVKNLDLGFKIFKLDSSNIKGWDGNPDNLEQSLFDTQDNIKTDRTEEDVLFEILLKYGLDLTLPIEEKIIEGRKVFNVGLGALFICLADDINSKVAEGIGAWKQLVNPETCRVIFKDSGFTDVEKTNAVQTLKRFGIHEIKSI
jgi:adenine-specific DNA-methyltransferase